MVTFTQSELAAAILGAHRDPEDTPNSITTSELARALPCAIPNARRFLRDALDAGLVRAEWIVRVSPHGVARRYEGYVLVEKDAAS